LAAIFLVLAVGSYISVLVAPSFAVHATVHPGAWKGLWYEKNGLGQIMTWGVLACGAAALTNARPAAVVVDVRHPAVRGGWCSSPPPRPPCWA
jgi:hypothetical protein